MATSGSIAVRLSVGSNVGREIRTNTASDEAVDRIEVTLENLGKDFTVAQRG